MSSRRIVATAALPYANGSIHLGHLVEYLQTDMWVRFQKMRGNECLYICADDTHGTPIMIRARQENITPEELIAKSQEEHQKDFAEFEIEFDHYSSTHSEENKKLCHAFFEAMEKAGHIRTTPVEQNYCENDEMFLPDRFVKGTCPQCGAEDQYGDSCDRCGATYNPTEMRSPACTLCGTPPVRKSSEHVFFKLTDFKDFLQEWVPQHTSREVAKKLQDWMGDELRDWDISRDKPYFGFSIPNHPEKYFYVWVDAPMGYISSTAQWCQENQRDLSEFWQSDDSEVYHFIGKDIVYFHALFWPVMLKVAGYNRPNQVFVHGFLTVNGEKMSKSKGTFIRARTYLNHLPPLYLRYYYACKMTQGLDDIDLNLDDFIGRVNSDLIGKITNLGSRGVQMLHKKLDGRLGQPDSDGKRIIEKIQQAADLIADLYEKRQFSRVITNVRDLADETNRYFDQKEPWKLVKTDPEATRAILTSIVNVFRLLTIYLKPVLPSYAEKVSGLLNENPYDWESLKQVLVNQATQPYEHLAKRLDRQAVEATLEESKESTQ